MSETGPGPAVRRLAVMFSVATLAVASPIYLRLVEAIGVLALTRLVLLAHVGPTLALWAVDELLARRAPTATWRVWRGLLYGVALLSVLRQTQVSLVLPGTPFGIPARVVIAVAIAAVAVAVAVAFRPLGRFFVAFAVPLLAWTVFVAFALGPSASPSDPARPAEGGTPAPVFVLLFDELDPAVFMRDGRVLAGWPALGRLAAMSLAFSDATANYGDTCSSVASLLTGRLLSEPRPPNSPRCLEAVPELSASNVFEDLARERRVRVYGQYLRYCFGPAAFRCQGTDLGARQPWLPLLRHWNPQGVPTERLIDPYHAMTLPLFGQFLADVTASAAPGTVYYLHLLLPHGPYVYDERGRLHAPSSFRPSDTTRQYVATLRDYVAQARFVDRLVGRFLARLDAQKLTDRSIVIVTSDHGLPSLEPFAPPRIIDGIDVNNARPRVPLLVHAPGLAPGITGADYQHRDFRTLLATVLRGDRLVPAAWRAPGRVDGEKTFSFRRLWYVRGENGAWRPRGPAG